jgi:hypothetical protein
MPDPTVTTTSPSSATPTAVVAQASTAPEVTTATAVPQPTGDLNKDILNLLSDMTFDGAGQEKTTNLANDPEITAAEMAWDKVDSKFKEQQQPAVDGEQTAAAAAAAVDPSQASSEAQAAAENGSEPSQTQPQSALGEDGQPVLDSPALDADDLDDPALPTVIDITKPRGQRIYAAYKAMSQLASPPEQGGIGHVPTPEQVSKYFTAHLEIHRLLNDYSDPNPQVFISGLEKTDPAALDRLAVALPQHIQRANPQAYEQLAVPVLENAIGALIDHARVAGNQADKDHWFNVANSLKFYLSDGKEQLDRTVLDKPIDQDSGIRSDYERLKSAESQRQAQDYRQAAQEFTQTLGKDTHTALLASIEGALVNVKPSIPAKVYSDLVNSVFNEVKNSVITDRLAQTSISNAKRNAQLAGAIQNRGHWDAHVKSITGTYMQFAQPRIAAAARARMAAYTKTAVAQSQAQQPVVSQQARTAQPGQPGQPQATPIRRGAPAGTSQRQTNQNPLSGVNSPANQPGNKTGQPRQMQTNAEQALEQIYQILQ